MYIHVHVHVSTGKAREEFAGFPRQLLSSSHQPEGLDCDGRSTRAAQPMAGKRTLHHWRQAGIAGFPGKPLPQLYLRSSGGECLEGRKRMVGLGVEGGSGGSSYSSMGSIVN